MGLARRGRGWRRNGGRGCCGSGGGLASSGATFFVGEVGVKASRVDRQASFSKLQQRLGVYEPSSPGQDITCREAERIQPEMPGWHTYISGKKAHEVAKIEARLRQQKQHEQERQQLAERHRAERRERKVKCSMIKMKAR